MTSSRFCWAVWNWTKLTVEGLENEEGDDEEEAVYRRADLLRLRQVESGTPAADVCRQLGCSEATFYIWKKSYGALGMTELKELRQLRHENARLKREHRPHRSLEGLTPREFARRAMLAGAAD